MDLKVACASAGTLPPKPTVNNWSRSSLVLDHQAAFQRATGLSFHFVRADNFPERTPESGNPFCFLLQRTRNGCAACRATHMMLKNRAECCIGPQSKSCFAGLTEVVVPVLIDGRPLVILWIGQVFEGKRPRDHFESKIAPLARELTYQDACRLAQAYRATLVVTSERLRAAAYLLDSFGRDLGEHASVNGIDILSTEPLGVARARRFIKEHFSESIALTAMAHNANLAPSYLCRLFKTTTRLTLREYLTRVRLEKARILLANPALRITEISGAAGFGSIAQFNAIFKRYTGTSPTEYRHRWLKSFSR